MVAFAVLHYGTPLHTLQELECLQGPTFCDTVRRCCHRSRLVGAFCFFNEGPKEGSDGRTNRRTVGTKRISALDYVLLFTAYTSLCVERSGDFASSVVALVRGLRTSGERGYAL